MQKQQLQNEDPDAHQEQLVIDTINQLPLSERLKAIALSQYRKQWLEAERQLNKKIDDLKKEHFLNLLPLQQKSNEIIQGIRIPTQEELKDAKQFLNENEIKLKDAALVKEPMKEFWARVLISATSIAELCSEEDLEILKSLVKVENVFEPGSLNFTLRFEFAENDFFQDKVLEKKFYFEGSNGDYPVRAEGTNIKWKQGKNITKRIQKKKQRNKKTGGTRIVEKEISAPTFFQFFKQKIEEEDDEDQIQEKLGLDYDIGQSLVEEIIPGALDYYLGIQKENLEKISGEGFDDDGEDDEDDDDDDQDCDEFEG